MLIRLAFIITMNVLFIKAENILFIAAIPSPSHHIWNDAIIKELAKRGHNVTVLSPDYDKNPPPGVHYIWIEDQYTEEHREFIKVMLASNEGTNPLFDSLEFSTLCIEMCQIQAKTNGFKTLKNYPDDFKFDLIIHDYTLGPCFLPFVHKFNNPPLISVTGYSHPSFTESFAGGHQYYSYVPHNSLLSDENMHFGQRFYNFILHIIEYVIRQTYCIPGLDAVAKEAFGLETPSVGDIERQTAIVLVSTNPAMDYLAPLPQNVIPVAGVQIKEPKPIPMDLKTFIDSSKKGVVIFSLGTNFRSDYLPLAKQKLFINVFSELPDYHFLWKFESNIAAADLPKNVIIRPWLPVSDILADPKTKAIFYHGGLLTTQEAMWRGVPMIIMPFGYDQNQNLIKTRRHGISEGIDYLSLNKDDTKKTLLKVLEEPSYALNATKWSARFRDQKEKPLERAVWWIEWVLRNPNSDYLKSPVLQQGFIIGNAYDIIATITIIITVLLVVLFKLLFICISKCTSSKNDRKNKATHKKQQ